MFNDEDLPRKKPESKFPRNLENMSVSELEDYIADLQVEIDRARQDIEKKKASQEAASSVFK